MLHSREDDPPPKNKLEAFWMWLVRTAFSLFQLGVPLTRVICLDVILSKPLPVFIVFSWLLAIPSCFLYIIISASRKVVISESRAAILPRLHSVSPKQTMIDRSICYGYITSGKSTLTWRLDADRGQSSANCPLHVLLGQRCRCRPLVRIHHIRYRLWTNATLP